MKFKNTNFLRNRPVAANIKIIELTCGKKSHTLRLKVFDIFEGFFSDRKTICKKLLTSVFKSCYNLQLFAERRTKILGDIFVIHTWIQTSFRTNGATAVSTMQLGGSLFIGLCAGIENRNYQPKPGGLDRLNRKI